MDVEVLKHYRIFEKIGEGINGIVYKAWDTRENRQVALKILKPQGVNALTKQIWQNIKSLVNTDHPNFACIYNIEQYEETTYIVSEFLDGNSLKDLMLHQKSDEIRPFKLLEQLISALKELYKLKLVHGNLKPTNLKIAADGRLILLDPFLSQFGDYSNRPDFVIPYEAYHYISPEQIEGKDITNKTDFFAAGIIMYQLITGKLPFMGNNEDELTKAILYQSPDFEKLKSKSFNSIRLLILQKLLAKIPSERFTDTDELLTTLKEISYLDRTVETIQSNYVEKKNPRPYLLVSILIALVFILWFIVSSGNN